MRKNCNAQGKDELKDKSLFPRKRWLASVI